MVSCRTTNRDTKLVSGDVSMVHAAQVQAPPEITEGRSEGRIDIPPASTIKVVEIGEVKADSNREFVPQRTETTVVLPPSKGATIFRAEKNTKITGSKGFEPEKGPTPTQKANAWWTYIGIAMTAAGVFFCTPWGGTNFRIGGIIAAGGVGMAVIGKFIDQINIPAPAMFLLCILLALGVYYGYMVRHKQSLNPKPVDP